MRFHVRGIDHLRVDRSAAPSKLPEQVFPDAAPRPAQKAVIDRCRRTIVGRAIAPATAALQHVHDAADDAAIVHPLDAPDIRRQVRFDPFPLLIAQPKQVPAHDPNPLPKTNQDRILRAEKLMSSDPSFGTSAELRRLLRFPAVERARQFFSDFGFGRCRRVIFLEPLECEVDEPLLRLG
jgi:hypothetical protein